MKKLALLLGALSLVSSVAYAKEVVPAVEEVVVVEEVKAAPTLRVTNFGQSIEVDNNAGHAEGDVGNVMLGHTVGLAYGDDWTFSFFARKGWDMDTDDGIHSEGHRIEIDAWRAFDNYDLGFRWRQESTKDRYYARAKYSYGMLSGSADVWYESNNANDGTGNPDNYEMELIPVKLTYGPFGIGYFFNYLEAVGSVNDKEDFDHAIEHQISAYANFDLTEKLSAYAEYRVTLGREVEDPKGEKYDLYDAGDFQKIEIGASYDLTENLTLSTYYAYEYGNVTDDAHKKHDENDKRYGEFWAGWNYRF